MNEILKIIQSGESRPIFCITGSVHAGKTTLAAQWVAYLRQNNVPCSGLLEYALIDRNGSHTGYELESIATGERKLLAHLNTGEHKGLRCGRYIFDPQAWVWAQAQIENCDSNSVIFLDELGRLESQKQGLWGCAQIALQRLDIQAIVFVCRWDLLHQFEREVGGFTRVCKIPSCSVPIDA